jgi:hypothetical protein
LFDKGWFVSGLKQTIIRGGLEGLYFTGAHMALKPFVAGVGAILTLHHYGAPVWIWSASTKCIAA